MSVADKFKIKISKKGYKEKPKAEDIKEITWSMKNNECKSVNYKELADIISKGHSVLLADFKEVGNIKEDNIVSLSCIALDIDSKENKITMYEMISKINHVYGIYPIIYYCTFSDADTTKFRLIYRLENKIDVETYRALYLAFQWKFEKYLDQATKNANRIWAGTNKNVFYNKNDKPITFDILVKMIKTHAASIARVKAKEQAKMSSKYIRCNRNVNFENEEYIKPEYKKKVLDYLINEIDIREFIPKHLGGRFKKHNEKLIGACVLHGGDNESALVIDEKMYTCFTHCGSGNIITAARKIYNIDNFSQVAFKLLEEFNLSIPEHYIKKGGEADGGYS